MKKAIIAISLVMVVVLVGGILAFGDPGPGTGRGAGYGKHMRWWENPELNLSPEQKAKLESQFLAHRKEIAPIRNSLIQKRLELEALLAQIPVAKDKVLAKQKELMAIRDTLQEKHLGFQIEQRQVLTPEQQTLAGPIRLHRRAGLGRGHDR